MGLRSNLTTKVGAVFTKVWSKLEGSGSISLLKASETLNEFEEIAQINSGWFLQYDDSKNFLLEIASTDDLEFYLDTTTHIQVGEDIYVIRRGDTEPPRGTQVTWKLYCQKYTLREQFGSLY